MSRLTEVAPPGGRRRTSNPGWPRGPPPVGASRRDLPPAAPGEDPNDRLGTGVRFPSPPRALSASSERCWRCLQFSVPTEDDAGPFEGIFHPNAAGLWPNPELEILGSIVVLHAVQVVDGLVGKEMPAEQVLHDQDVLKHVPLTATARMAHAASPLDSPPYASCGRHASSRSRHRPTSDSQGRSRISPA